MNAPSPSSSIVREHCLSPSRTRHAIDRPISGAARYARLFSDLPAYEADEALLHTLGKAGGPCDCAASAAEAPDGEAAAGWPIFGQFIAHDITADRSPLQSRSVVEQLRNARSPALDLDCLYGDGPAGHPFLFTRNDPAKFVLGSQGLDVQRNAEGTAVIGDPRNDSHMLMSQMHLAMQKLHNALVDRARERSVPERGVFDEASRWCRWAYQWVVVNEFLPGLVGPALVDEVLDQGPRYFKPGEVAFIPLEFADAAYRYGHCQIRSTYQLGRGSNPVSLFPDLLGFRPVPEERAVDWTLFFDTPGHQRAQRVKKIDGRLVGGLIQLPVAITGECEIDEYHSLAVRDLQRGQGAGLPSGEAIARRIGVAPLTAEQVGLSSLGWKGETPLWYYILREAAVCEDGDRLGPVGGRIVTEVLMVLLDRDPAAYRSVEPEWTPQQVDPSLTGLASLLALATRRQ